MNGQTEEIGRMVRSLPADRLLASVGIPLLLHSETLFNSEDDLDAREALAMSHELYILSAILAALCTQHERVLKTLTVDLPEEVGGLTIKNPLYEPKTEEPPADADGSTSETGDEFPF